MQVLALGLVLLCYRSVAATTIVVPSTTEPSHGGSENATSAKPRIYYLHVESDIKYRYAKTEVTAKIANPADVAQQVFFTVVLPETAFISGFVIEIDGKTYKAYVKEKEAAKQEYDDAVRHGQTAAHVALSPRDSNKFEVSLNVEPQKKVTFNLTYEELLARTLGVYKDVINLDPGQIVPDLSVVVRILDSNDITTLKVPALKVSNEIDANPNPDATNPLAKIERPTPETAVVTFAPTPDQQKDLASNGIKGQLIVEYDVNRTEHAGEVLVSDGYFVHFFSPSDLKPLPKHVTFVLDVSGSMSGRKIEQLRQAMATILGDLNKDDFFSIVLFSQTAQVWDPTLSEEDIDQRLRLVGSYSGIQGEAAPATVTPSVIAKVTPDNIDKAKKFVEKLTATSSTNIYDGLMLSLEIANLERKLVRNDTSEQKPEPIIIFLTDGLPNVRVSDPDTIVKDVTKANTANSSIFSLGLGDDVNFEFLKKLSLSNSGFARKIYEAGDTNLQLTHFYSEISSPLLAHVTFEYVPSDVENGTVTKHVFRRLFAGSELVVAGRLKNDTNFTSEVLGTSVSGRTEYKFRPIIIPYPIPDPPLRPFPHHPPFPHPPFPLPPVHNHTPSSLERMWAYLTIQQLLEEDQAKDYDHNDKNQTSPEKEKALDLALKYSFVTPLTSLVVVKPNETKAVDTEDASQTDSGPGHSFGNAFSNRIGISAIRPMFLPPFNAGGTINYLSTRMPYPPLTTRSPLCLSSLSDITWLNGNNTVTLPVGVNKADELFQVAGANETNSVHSSCTAPTGEAGQCRHLRYCVLNFTAKKEDFVPYFCGIDSYVGVCCPDRYYSGPQPPAAC